MSRLAAKTAILLLLLLPGLASANDAQQPISLLADRVTVDERNGRSHYQGRVELRQGSMELKSDSLITQRESNNATRIEARGNPVTLTLTASDGTTPIRAEAEQLRYHPADGEMLLSGKAQLWRDGDRFAGERITYRLSNNQVEAEGGAGGGRVEVILQPRGEP
jgi:lipopolysaccharide export system protein LptA